MGLFRDQYGSLVVDEMPSESELIDHYNFRYYDGKHTNYPSDYTDEEIDYLHFRDKVLYFFLQTKFNKLGNVLLDIGCGEGFTLNYFYEKGYSCYGADFTSQGLEKEHPDLLNNIQFRKTNIITGDYFEDKVFDVIVGNGILEHVVDKATILQRVRSKLTPGGCLFIGVPNDFSSIHHVYIEKNNLKMEECPWYAAPEHLTYFNAASLKNTIESFGFETISIMGDFPVEMFLFNKDTDFYNTNFGRTAHQIRVSFLNLIAGDIKKAIKFCTSLSDMGVGRDLMGVFRKI